MTPLGHCHSRQRQSLAIGNRIARRLFRLAVVELPLDVQFIQAPTNETDRMLSNDLDPDTVLVAGSVKRPKRVIIVELHQAWDPGKLRQWPRYAASKWLRYECPVQLLVICSGRRHGRSVRRADPDQPRRLHALADRSAARARARFRYRCPGHGRSRHGDHVGGLSRGADEAVIRAFAAGILTLSPDRAKKYYEYGLRMSPEFVRNALEHLMATKYNEPFSKLGLTYYGQGREEGREEGLVAGERGTVHMVLKARGLPVSDSQRARIDACDDLAALKVWAEAALTAATVDDLFK
jgi:hypothetical protein